MYRREREKSEHIFWHQVWEQSRRENRGYFYLVSEGGSIYHSKKLEK